MKKLIAIGSLIDQSWEHYRKHFPTLIKLSLWTLIVTAINVVAIGLYPINASELTRSLNVWEITGLILFVVNNTIFASIIGIWVVNTLITAIHNQDLGKKIQMVQLHKVGWKLFIPQLIVRIYLGIIFVTAVAIPLVAFWFITNVLSTFLPTMIILLLLFVSMILFVAPLTITIYLALALFALIIDGHQGINALKKSASLVKGRFWSVLARLALPKLLYFGIFFLAQFLLTIILEVVVFGLLGGTNDLAIQRANWLILPTSYAVLFVFMNPLLLITDHKIYKDLS